MEEEELSIWVGQFVDESKSTIDTALMVAKLSVEIISQGRKFEDSFFQEMKSGIRVPYERALETLPKDSRERRMLKEAYASLVSIFEDFLPHETEDLCRYENRITERIFQFNILANRLALGG